jgi:hypothetical protein
MSDLSAGTTVRAGDTPPAVSDEQSGSYTVTITTFGITAASGSYADCGVAFVAPTTGRVLVTWSGQVANNTAGGACELSPYIREGTVVGSGTAFLASVIDNKTRLVSYTGGAIQHAGMTMLVEGLTPGDDYNVRLDHRVSGNTGTFIYRKVAVIPCS